MRSSQINDEDREDWINNDEGLYNWWLDSKLSMRKFIAENRAEITRIIKAALG